MTYEIPAEWAATSDPKGAPALDPKPDVRANRCTKVLLWMKAPGGVEGRFNSIAALLAIDPQCISGPEFPQAVTDTDKIIKVADKIIKYYKNAPFFSPYGVENPGNSHPGGAARARDDPVAWRSDRQRH